MTKTGLAVEEPNQLCTLAIRQATDGLRLADAALVEEPGRLHAPELRHGHQHVEHLRGRDVLRRAVEDVLDRAVDELTQLVAGLVTPAATMPGR